MTAVSQRLFPCLACLIYCIYASNTVVLLGGHSQQRAKSLLQLPSVQLRPPLTKGHLSTAVTILWQI